MTSVLQYIASVATVGLIFSIACLGLNVRYGWTGNLDLSYYMFIALGAYMQAVFTLPRPATPSAENYILGLHLPYLVGLAGAVLTTALVSLALGAVALRTLRGDYFAIVTIVTTLIVYSVIQEWNPLFNGYVGLYAVPQFLRNDFTFYGYPWFLLILCAVSLLLVYVVVERVFKSEFGRALRACREAEPAAAAFGRNVYVMKLKAFTLSGAIGGFAGALLITWLGAWNPGGWTPIEVLLLYAALFVGGTGNNRGVIIGAFFIFVVIQEATRNMPLPQSMQGDSSIIQGIVVALLIGVMIWFRPRGILPEPRARLGSASPHSAGHPRDPRPTRAAPSEHIEVSDGR